MNAEAKLSNLKSARKKLKVSGDSTSDVRKCVAQLAVAFKDYIKSDNLSSYSIITSPLLETIEEHTDFKSAVRYLNRAILEAEEEIERRRQEERDRLLGGM